MIFSTLRENMKKRAECNRIAREIREMPADVARDLNIYPGDADQIAFTAVYGK
ncbi:hypothetical protein [Puniceibacterium sp. IMCC21224]|uniref:hypothetical protein n=1 Tax=Puniceibacterium sp. IMCC21224 TaxID=1618204 RepID=UPI00065D720D|nr:hypothetical protein [Puniceibacterium sp. IMCC21224]KMK67414.1 hypothetical protein IMCC21224_112283 [Puniceibacterium sp. IMCC21224]